jgi:hypothetical protein
MSDHIEDFFAQPHPLMSERELQAFTTPPTRYRCTKCGCLWRRHTDGSWSLYDAEQSPQNCCDNATDFLSVIVVEGTL